MSTKHSARSHKPQSVLVVGDWIFDEHWVTGTHRSTTSSRIGRLHVRALHAHDHALYGFCGAAGSASIINHATFSDGSPRFIIFGAGVWDRGDTDALWTMLNLPPKSRPTDGTRPYQSPYRITRDFSPLQKGRRHLLNFGEIIEKIHENGEKKVRCGTMRVIRLYRYEGSTLELIARVDWEPKIPDGRTAWIENLSAAAFNTLKSRLRELLYKKNIGAVVLHDMNKGGISTTLVDILKEIVPETAKWFIATKAWRPASKHGSPHAEEPSWLSRVPKARLRLLFIPQTATRRMVEEGEISRWMPRYGVPSDEALTIMNDLCNGFPQASIVVLPDSCSILARDPSPAQDLCIVQTDKRESDIPYGDEEDESEDVGLSLTSVLFPSIVAQMLSFKKPQLGEILPPALQFTNRRMQEESDRIKRPETANLPEFAGGHLTIRQSDWELACKEMSVSQRFNKPAHVRNWKVMKKEWEDSFKGIGMLDGNSKHDTEKRIELWRAMTELPNYVCCVHSKRTAIRQILQQVNAFKMNPQQHRSLMIIADPGAGKTHLAKQLACSHEFALLPLNITQMLSRKDILDFFDAVSSEELRAKGKHLLVFVDEINALLDGQHVYDAFLSPIGDGVYIRGGMTFHIDPCFWLFASTEDPTEHPDKSAKGRDFVSRLTLHPLPFKAKKDEEPEVRNERAYLGVCMLRKHYPDIRSVSEKVLKAFEFLRPDVENREIEKFVSSFCGIQNGQVVWRNVPTQMFEVLTHPHSPHAHHATHWLDETTPEGPMVEISN